MRRFIPALVVLLARPRTGVCQLGLAETLGAKRAMQLSQLFIDCALEDARVWPGRVVLAVPEQDRSWAEYLADSHQQKQPWLVACHDSHGLMGETLTYLDLSLREQGLQQFIYIFADAPVLSGDHYRKAILILQNYDVVLSHEATSGLSLIANTRPWPSFTAIDWRNTAVAEQLQLRCIQSSFSVSDIQAGYAIKQSSDLLRLQHDLAQDKRPARMRLMQALQPVFSQVTA
ncbi:DUF2064 domain-containing protein [Motilimonas cestriensis]|uniref:DUF2064 domain-containing protein n=1 Tax=Motilimonas cestriensis TaxID=2742685 RepID=A0ABS8WHK4_9GAMM|nr:DUF2064 domain-containing protein [Motilimonas cestriensis]MCE2596855.1 DUF2064 domain-containing protein [Motilimonas cestriensis]